MINESSSKTIETLPIIRGFPGLNNQDGIIPDPWEDFYNISYCPDENNPHLRIIKVKKWLHHLESVADVPKQVADDKLIITYYKDCYNFANKLTIFLNKKGIDTELRPFEYKKPLFI